MIVPDCLAIQHGSLLTASGPALTAWGVGVESALDRIFTSRVPVQTVKSRCRRVSAKIVSQVYSRRAWSIFVSKYSRRASLAQNVGSKF